MTVHTEIDVYFFLLYTEILPNGDILLASPLDREENDVIMLKWTSRCHQGGHLHRHHNCKEVTSHLHLRDKDDNPPRFVTNSLSKTSFASVTSGHTIRASIDWKCKSRF